jgi:hypothetical protein
LNVFLFNETKKANKKFNKILLEVVDKSLARIGKSVGPVVYYNLERDFVKKREIPVKTERFSACLKMIFGEGVAYLIEMAIVERLYVEIDEKLEEKEDHSFTDYVNNAREKYLKKGREHLRG